MSFQGKLETIQFTDILQLLTVGKKSGTLSVIRDEKVKVIYFKSGRIIAAETGNKEEMLLTLIPKRTKISRQDLDRALKIQAATGKTLAETLLELQLLSQEELSELIRMQVEEIIFDIFGWENGDFVFQENILPQTEFILTAINTMNLLMEGSRRIDEWTRVKKQLPQDHAILRVATGNREGQEIRLTQEEVGVLSLIDGERSIEEVKEKSAVGEFATAKAIYSLLIAGLVEQVGVKRSRVSVAKEQDIVLGLIESFYGSVLQHSTQLLTQKLGAASRKAIISAVERTRVTHPLIGHLKLDMETLRPIYDDYRKQAEALPETGRYHQAASALLALGMEVLAVVNNLLGEKMAAQVLVTIRTNTQDLLTQNQALIEKYGLVEDFRRIVK